MIFNTFAVVTCDADDPCSVNIACDTRSSYTNFGVQLDLCTFVKFSHSLSTAVSVSRIFITLGIRINLCTSLSWIREWLPFPAMWSSSLGRVPSKRFLVDSSTSTMHASFWLAIVSIATGLPVLTFPDLTRTQLLPSEFPAFYSVSSGSTK